jgi:hypothetical protein
MQTAYNSATLGPCSSSPTHFENLN